MMKKMMMMILSRLNLLDNHCVRSESEINLSRVLGDHLAKESNELRINQDVRPIERRMMKIRM